MKVKPGDEIFITLRRSREKSARGEIIAPGKGVIRPTRFPEFFGRRRIAGDGGGGEENPDILIPTIEFLDVQRIVLDGSTTNVWFPAGAGGAGGYVALYTLLQRARFNISNSDGGVQYRIVEVRYTTFGASVETVTISFNLVRGTFTGQFSEPFFCNRASNDPNHHTEEFRVRNVTSLGFSGWSDWQTISYRVNFCEIGSTSPAEPNVYDDATFTWGGTPDGDQTIMSF